MKEIIEIPRAGKSPSKVVVGNVLTSLRSFLPERKVVIITDANVHRRHKELINQFDYILVGIGETAKTLATAEKIYRELLSLGADRQTFIVGMGGGVVTDLAGFAASTFMRGVGFGFVPTTLLAQVDASIGGKNGVDVDGYKNMAGTFNQPDFVLCDTQVLSTLPERELRSGMAEVVKAAVIDGGSLFALLEAHPFDRLRGDEELMRRVITSSIRIKAAIVAGDEREAGHRRILNLGHTFGHAIEKCSQAYTHGEAVAIGLAMICDVAVRLGFLSEDDRMRIKGVIERMGLPLSTSIEPKQLLRAISLDKKRDSDHIHIVLPHAPGDCRIHPLPPDVLLG